jgi:hypothetical protein
MKHDYHVTQRNSTQVHGCHMVAKHPAFNDNNWCAVDALATALGMHHITAYEYCRQAGRKHGRGMLTSQIDSAYQVAASHRGLTCRYINGVRARKDYGKTIVSARKHILPNERIVLDTANHVVGFYKATTNDWAIDKRKRVIGAWRFSVAA